MTSTTHPNTSFGARVCRRGWMRDCFLESFPRFGLESPHQSKFGLGWAGLRYRGFQRLGRSGNLSYIYLTFLYDHAALR